MAPSRIAIVTGASRGIGAEIALSLARKGHDVAITYTSTKSTSQAEAIASQIIALGQRALLVRKDLADPDCGEVILKEVLAGFKTEKVDVLVNNAGVTVVQESLELDIEDFTRVWKINTLAPALLVKAIGPHFNPSGRIVSISSILSRGPYPGYDAYVASKVALEGLTRQWAVTLAKRFNITANAIIVGSADTEMIRHAPKEALDAIKAVTSAAARLGTTDDVAQVVCWLASEEARWINGQCIGAHGGMQFY